MYFRCCKHIVWKWGMDMYNTLWNYLKHHMKSKYRPAGFLTILTVGWAITGVLAGLLVCLGIQKELIVKLTVILCTGGYAGLILGFFGGIFYLYRMDLRRRFSDYPAEDSDKKKASVNSFIYLTNKKAV